MVKYKSETQLSLALLFMDLVEDANGWYRRTAAYRSYLSLSW